jgi:hypothetical protein
MQRRFIEAIRYPDGGMHWAAGEVRDYPISTWRQIAQGLNVTIDEITEVVDPMMKADTAPAPRRHEEATIKRQGDKKQKRKANA